MRNDVKNRIPKIGDTIVFVEGFKGSRLGIAPILGFTKRGHPRVRSIPALYNCERPRYRNSYYRQTKGITTEFLIVTESV
jgi:hypothetical protein